MTKPNSPSTVKAYLAALKSALSGAPRGLIRDALADAEEHLRSEMSQNAGKTEAEILEVAIETYGTPSEIAQEYRAMESTLAGPFPSSSPDDRKSSWGFGVIADPTAYGALLYMLLSLATGVFYFSWTIVGLSLMPLMLILVVAIPIAIVFIGSERVLALIEGRLVETLLGVRMPRRLPAEPGEGMSFLGRIKAMLTDGRTWTSMLYLLLMLPLGTAYFSIAVTLLALSAGLAGGGLYQLFSATDVIQVGDWAAGEAFFNSVPGLISLVVVGVLMLFVTLNVAKAIGWFHGKIAEALLAQI